MENEGFLREEEDGLAAEDQMSVNHFHEEASVTDEAHQITFSWENLTVMTKGKSRTIENDEVEERSGFFGRKRERKLAKYLLRDVSGYVKPGEMVAIMGASGAGKSTLLNTLTFRNLAGLEVTSGRRYANGVPVSPNALTSVSAYVQQDDLFIGTLTVRELLVFQALVRMESHLPRQHRLTRVEAVISELGLSKCSDTLIGIPGRVKGVSGGELKRLAFACEVLTNPSLFFCDEPTSGLDSYMAMNVVQVLRTLARQGKTIVCTIHQPSSQVFALFDRVLLMAEGKLAFLGQAEQAMEFFQNIGHPCPVNYNPADHYVHVLAITLGKEKTCRKRVAEICDAFDNSEVGKEIATEIESQKAGARNRVSSSNPLRQLATDRKRSPYRANWWQQFTALIWRSSIAVLKEPLLIRVRFIQTLLISLILGVIYLGQDYQSQEGVMNINGAIFLMMTNMTFQNMFAVIQVFCNELPIFLREHFNGMYRTDCYYIAKQLADLPIFFAVPIIYVSIFYFMVGCHPDLERFLLCIAIMILFTQVVISFGYLISCAAPDLQMALALASPLMIPIMLFGGFFLHTSSIPDWLYWVQYVSWFRYGNELLIVNQWRNVTMTCGGDNSTACTYRTGEDIIAFFGFDEDNVTFDIAMLVALTVGFRIVGFLLLLAKTYRKNK